MICSGCSRAIGTLKKYLMAVRRLAFTEIPDYSALKDLFLESLKSNGKQPEEVQAEWLLWARGSEVLSAQSVTHPGFTYRTLAQGKEEVKGYRYARALSFGSFAVQDGVWPTK
jgi:hypothetical protein